MISKRQLYNCSGRLGNFQKGEVFLENLTLSQVKTVFHFTLMEDHYPPSCAGWKQLYLIPMRQTQPCYFNLPFFFFFLFFSV